MGALGEIGTQVAMTLSGRLVEIEFNPDAGTTYYVPDGEHWCIESVTFEAMLQPLPG